MSDTFKAVPVVFTPKTYPMIGFIVRHGRLVAWLVGLVPLIASLLLLAAGVPAWSVLVGAAGSLVAVGLLLSYVELVCVIDDMLLPK